MEEGTHLLACMWEDSVSVTQLRTGELTCFEASIFVGKREK